MYKMCHFCGVELKKLDSGEEDKEKEKRKKENPSRLDGGDPVLSCKFCSEKSGKECSMPNDLSPYATPLISPTVSASSTDSFFSSCSEFLFEANSHGSEENDESGLESLDRPGTITVENLEDNNNSRNVHNSLDQGTLQEVQIIEVGDDPERKEDGVDSTAQSFATLRERIELSYSQPLDIETDLLIWVPPEPEDLEDDMESSVANNEDDDDECGDGMKWGRSNSLSRFGNESSHMFRFKEERKKAMVEVMNGEFKNLVSRLLLSEGISLSGEPGENWLDIVTSLAWEAASLVKPDAIESKTMDLDDFVKVKCIATGSHSQSQVFKGLVFKKSAAHKHMPTKFKNPRLLLLQGMLGQHSSGLSSFHSMEMVQEVDNLRSVIEMIEMCHPNVVLVEKTVSRDVQESFLDKGITLVFDMKLHRLERIASYTGSQIVSSTDSLMKTKLKKCNSFHFEKFVEEHGGYGGGGKRPRTTLMFLEGFPRFLGCTDLLSLASRSSLSHCFSLVPML